MDKSKVSENINLRRVKAQIESLKADYLKKAPKSSLLTRKKRKLNLSGVAVKQSRSELKIGGKSYTLSQEKSQNFDKLKNISTIDLLGITKDIDAFAENISKRKRSQRKLKPKEFATFIRSVFYLTNTLIHHGLNEKEYILLASLEQVADLHQNNDEGFSDAFKLKAQELVQTRGDFAEAFIELLEGDTSEVSPYLDIKDVKPKEFWKNRDRSLGESIPEFIARVYEPWIGKGLTRAHLKVDPTLYGEQAKWVSKNGGSFPDWLNVPKAYKNRDTEKAPTTREYEIWRRVAAYMSKNT